MPLFVRWPMHARYTQLESDVHPDFQTAWSEVKQVNGALRAYNFAGGFCNLDESLIVERVEAEDFSDLDWRRTYMARPGEGAGWISPTGEWLQCPIQGHDQYAEFILHREVGTLERSHVRVYGPPGHHMPGGTRPWTCLNYSGITPDQAWRLRTLGHTVEEEDVE